MTLRHMRIFAAVCEEESITRAAEKLGMTQPTVSVAVRELEDYYHTQLFERMNRRIYLTEAGRELYGYAQTIVNQFAEARNRLSGRGGESLLRIGSNVSFGAAGLAKILERYHAEHPDVPYRLHIANSFRIERMLLQNELDFAVVDNVNVSSFFVSRLIAQEDMRLYCGREYASRVRPPLGLEELSAHSLLLREVGSGSRSVIDQVFELHGLRVSPVMESTSTLAILQAAIHNLGICIVPEALIPKSAMERLIRIETVENYFLRRYFLIHHKNKYISDAMRGFFAYFVKR